MEVHGGKLVFVPLRGGREHPSAARTPVTTMLALKIPLRQVFRAIGEFCERKSVLSCDSVGCMFKDEHWNYTRTITDRFEEMCIFQRVTSIPHPKTHLLYTNTTFLAPPRKKTAADPSKKYGSQPNPRSTRTIWSPQVTGK